ncbi:hypothetical protein D3P08_20325 [Paenibacillus nanensis]|uniref:DUF3221 domain-containing protein n=2 Tax=Paenibacillus nanensis TaxID=393251 RepID=A0A3A1USP8_9BACL|nr:hypothetical protein D3P08_20325 [Paenibacillus nanensis]
MKTTFTVFLMVLLCTFLFACGSDAGKATFKGTIEEINGASALVNIVEGDILKSGRSVYVDLSVNSEVVFKVGDTIEVEYTGTVRETSPLSIDIVSVQFADE